MREGTREVDGKLRRMTAVYLLRGDRILLLLRQGGRVADGLWTGSAGGHFEAEDQNDARACVLRELWEEMGLGEEALEALSLRYLTVRRTAHEIRQTYYFFAHLKEEAGEEFSSEEGNLQWFPLDGISGLKMPLTARYVLEHYFAVGRDSELMYAGITQEDGVKFLPLPEV